MVSRGDCAWLPRPRVVPQERKGWVFLWGIVFSSPGERVCRWTVLVGSEWISFSLWRGLWCCWGFGWLLFGDNVAFKFAANWLGASCPTFAWLQMDYPVVRGVPAELLH